VAQGERTRLLDLIRGVGREGHGELMPVASLFTKKDGLTFVWQSEAHARIDLPVLILGSDEQLDDLLAWVAAYMRPLSPLTSLINVMSSGELKEAFDRASLSSTAIPIQASVGVVLAAAWLDIQKSNMTSPNPSLVVLSPAFTLARAGDASDLEDITRKWNTTCELLGAAPPSFPVDAVYRVIADLKSSSGVNIHSRAQAETLDDLFAAGSSSVEDALRAMRNSSSEDRVRFFDQAAPTLAASESRHTASRALAALAASCNPGDFETIGLLKPYSGSHPESVLWFGALQALSGRGSVFSAFDGLGWRVWRDLQPRNGVLERPTCDIAFRELRILSRSKSRSGVRGFLQGVRARAVVQLSHGANAAFRLRSPSTSGSSTVEVRGIGQELSPERGLFSMIQRLSNDLLSLQAEVSELKAGLSRGRSKRRTEKKQD